MGKEKIKGQTGPGQKHLYSRTSYLYQAATYLASIESEPKSIPRAVVEETEFGATHTNIRRVEELFPKIKLGFEREPTKIDTGNGETTSSASVQQMPLSRLLISHLKAVSLKGQIRLTPEMKHSLCKRCDTLLVPSRTSTRSLENKSRGGKKPCADVFVVTCNSCGTAKRFPVGVRRQRRKPARTGQEEGVTSAI